MNAPELVDNAGITYRQLDYWTRRGYLRPAELNPGCGRDRQYSLSETAVARRMGGLVGAGLTVESAASIARGDRRAVSVLLRTLAHILDEEQPQRGDVPAETREGA